MTRVFRGRATRFGVAMALALGVAVLGLPRAQADDGNAVLQRARTATVREDFSGIVQIEWLARGTWRTARVPVSGTGGTVQVGEGTRRAEGRDDERWIAGVSGWQAGWDGPVRGTVPKPSTHWKLTVAKGQDVASRPTTVVSASDPRTGTTRLKVYCDRDTGVMLRREVLDRNGAVVRAVGFVEVKKLGGARSAPPPDPRTATRASRLRTAPEALTSAPKGFDAPPRIGGGYLLAGRYLRRDGVVQLYYSDGLFGVSVFEQRGDLEWSGLPRGGGAVDVAGARARSYEVAGGTVVVWAHDGVTRTVVSDATVPDLDRFAEAFDAASAHGGGWLDDVTDFVLGPFGWN